MQGSIRLYSVHDRINSSNSSHFLDSLLASLLSDLCVHNKRERIHTQVCGLQIYPADINRFKYQQYFKTAQLKKFLLFRILEAKALHLSLLFGFSNT